MAREALNILVIDDDKGDRTFCQRALKSAWGDSLRFMEADSGERGLEAIEMQTPDCVLLDHSLPGINGIEVLRRIRLKRPYLPDTPQDNVRDADKTGRVSGLRTKKK